MTTPCQPQFQLPPCQRRVMLVCLTVPNSAETIQALQVRDCLDEATYGGISYYELDGITPIPDGQSRLVDCPRQVMSDPDGAIASATRVLYEAAYPYSYYGYAPPSASVESVSWTIVRSFNDGSSVILSSASSVTWEDRSSHVYT